MITTEQVEQAKRLYDNLLARAVDAQKQADKAQQVADEAQKQADKALSAYIKLVDQLA
jgi:hypothetical protein